MNSLFRLLPSLSLATFVVAGCTGGLDGEESTGKVPVDFATSVYTTPGGASRTIVGELTTDNLTSMGVFAYYTGQNDWITTHKPDFMYNQRMSRANSSSPWTYAPMKYWPNTPGDKVSFFAYAPHSTDFPSTLEISKSNADSGYPKLYFELPTAEDELVDLLYSPPVLNLQKGSVVSFPMKHALTRVEFRIRSTNPLTVTSYSLINVLWRGWLTMQEPPILNIPDYGPDQDGNYDEGGELMEIMTNRTVAVDDKDITNLACYYMVPYKPEITSFSLSYQYQGSTKSESQEFLLPETIEWGMGRYIIYTILIEGGSKITVSATDIGSDWPSTPEVAGDGEVSYFP